MIAFLSIGSNLGNRWHNLDAALAWLRGSDEIVIVDGCSEDNTVSIAKSYGAKVYLTKPLGYVEPCRMLGISKVTNEWVLYLDVDEVPSPNLIRDIKKIVNYATKHGYVAIRINRINFYGANYRQWFEAKMQGIINCNSEYNRACTYRNCRNCFFYKI